MSNKKVFILLTDTGTLFTKTIKAYTKKPYNHASIAFDEDLREVYSFGRKDPCNPFVGGFVREDTSDWIFQNASCAILRMTISPDEYNTMKQYIKKIEAEKDKYRYNLIGLFAIMINWELDRKNAFFCSQFVASVLNQSGRIHLDMPLSLVTPDDFRNIEGMELVYQGKMRDYNDSTGRNLVGELTGMASF
ncbi:hypothetical protein [Oceanobacillus sp. CAU 1775]